MSGDRRLKAFTMAEAILTMVILGVIAAIMIANLKPVQYRNEGFKVTKKKIYAELDDVINTILISCSSGITLSKIYDDCDEKDASKTHSFGATKDGVVIDSNILQKYIRKSDDCSSTLPTGYGGAFKLKNGACIALKADTIWIDINDSDGPNAPANASLDRMTLSVVTGTDEDGISTKPSEVDN